MAAGAVLQQEPQSPRGIRWHDCRGGVVDLAMLKKKRANRSENILVLGLGGVGHYLTKRLAHDGHAVTIIEKDRKLIRDVEGYVDARLIQGDALRARCWKEAGASDIDYLIAVTDNDAVNMLASMIADRSGIKRKIARVRSLDLGAKGSMLSAEDMKIDLLIHPEELTAQEIVRLIKLRAGNVMIDIGQGQMRVMATRVQESSPLAHKPVKDISNAYRDFRFRIVSMARGITTIIPDGDEEVLPQDQLFMLARSEDLPRLMELAGVESERHHRVMILGGGLVGSRIAQLLEGSFDVKLIEHDEQRAEELSHQLDHVEVLHGDGSDADTLTQAGLLEMDTLITATRNNETNIMSCLLAKHLMGELGSGSSVRHSKTIALVSKEEYLVLAGTMGADIALDKKVLAANEILKYIRRGKLLSVAHLHGFDADVVEIVADEGAPITRAPLRRLRRLRGKVIIGGVLREKAWRIAVGSTQIQPGDRAIAICRSRELRELQTLFLG
jgi:trk system potassium uptake protein TrkA